MTSASLLRFRIMCRRRWFGCTLWEVVLIAAVLLPLVGRGIGVAQGAELLPGENAEIRFRGWSVPEGKEGAGGVIAPGRLDRSHAAGAQWPGDRPATAAESAA